MATADRYRAFARKCMGWADRAKTIKHRELLLDMATRWLDAAAGLEYQRAVLVRFSKTVSEALSRQAAAVDGNSRPEEMESQSKEADGVSVVDHERQLPRETSAE